MSDRTIRSLGDLVEPITNWNPARAKPEEVFSYIDLSAVDQTAKAIAGAKEIKCEEAPSRARQLVAAGDILVSTVRPNLNGVARVPAELDGATASTGFCVLRPRRGLLDGAYLFHWVISPRFIDDMTSRATGASYPAVSDRIVLESHIPLVPIAEQRRIADMLDRAEALRAKRRAALAQLDTLAQSIFLDMFGDPAINPRRWPVKPLGAVTECLDSLRKPVKESDRRPGSVPYYGANGQQGWIDRPLFNEPLVLVAEDGGHFDEPERGVAYRIDGPAWVNNHAHILRPRGDALEIEYLHRALRYYDFRLFVSGTTRAKLTQQQLNSATIMAPPLALQRNFADRLLAVKALQATQSRSLNALDSLFASLQHRAFRGEL